jgi:hypothetical protein
MATNITPRLGEIVLYTLSEQDAKQIIQDRRNAGIAAARGNDPREGDTYPAIIVRDFGQTEEQYRQGIEVGKRNLTDQWRGANGHESPARGWPVEFRGMPSANFYKVYLPEWERSLPPFDPEAGACNLQVFLDGTDVYWATSRSLCREGDDPKGHFQYNPWR